MTPALSRAAAHAVNVWLIPTRERDRFVGALSVAETEEDLPLWARSYLDATAEVTQVVALPQFQFTDTSFTGVT